MHTTTSATIYHLGRSFGPRTPLEDECPCPQEPCGLIAQDKIDPACEQHAATKTMRQAHPALACPGIREPA